MISNSNPRSFEILKTSLSEIGLNDIEIMVYGAALSLGSRPASMIAKHAGLNRAHTYDVLSSLKKKGLMDEMQKNSVKHFSCSPPSSLLSLIQNQENRLAEQRKNLAQALPDLEKLRNPFLGDPLVQYFQGIDGIKKIFEDTLRSPKEIIYSFSDAEYSWTLQDEALTKWRSEYSVQRVKNDIWYMGIINDESEFIIPQGIDPLLKRDIRLLRGFSLPVEILAYGARVAILSTFQEKIGLIVENQNIADAVRNLHQIVWKSLPTAD